MNSYGPKTDFGAMVHAMKYRWPEESYDDYCVRYARVTTDSDREFYRLIALLRDQVLLPAGRQQRSVGRPHQVTAFNCYVGDTIPDDTLGIFNAVRDAAMTLRSGGGCGWDFSTLRPDGETVRGLGQGAKSSGPVSFMKVWHAMCGTIMSAGERRGAMMGVLRCDHPDILKFVKAKMAAGELTNFNISVAATDEFMEAVKNDGLYKLQFDGRSYGDVRALDVWGPIMDGNWDNGEPGILFIDRINAANPLYYCETIQATNPCFTGDTKVWTSKGPKTFKDLAQEDKNVEVLTFKDGRFVYRTMRRPRVTGRNKRLVEVTFATHGGKNGKSKRSTIRCTPSHEFYLRDGTRKAARDLVAEDRVLSVYRFPRGKGYLGLYNHQCDMMEHHVPFEDVETFGKIIDVHHEDENKHNNDPSNLKMVDHGKHSSEHKMGDNNPMRKHPELNHFRYKDNTGKNNGRYRDDLDDLAIKKMRESGMSYGAIAREMNCNKYTIAKRLGYVRPDAGGNHKVIGVRQINEREDVYCGTVDDTHSFFIVNGENDGVLVRNCAEQPLPPNGACLLGSVNVLKLLKPAFETNGLSLAFGAGKQTTRYAIDFDLLRHSVDAAVRAFDNVIDRTIYPLPAQEREAKAKRRMGVGATGLANAIETIGHPFGTPEYIKLQKEILREIAVQAYRTSCKLAILKGPFPLWDRDKYCEGAFFKRLPEDLQALIRINGLRNGLLTSIAPTGTISLAADNISGGIEPVFQERYNRLIKTPTGDKEFEIIDAAFSQYSTRARPAQEVTPMEHVAVLCAAQQWVDSSISKTINVAGQVGGEGPGTTFREFQDVYMACYEGGAKGCATFNSNGKRAGILRPADTVDEIGAGAACVFDPATGMKDCG